MRLCGVSREKSTIKKYIYIFNNLPFKRGGGGEGGGNVYL